MLKGSLARQGGLPFFRNHRSERFGYDARSPLDFIRVPGDWCSVPTPQIPFDACRAIRWQLPERSVTFGRRPLLMGIVNVTPDSFSDGGAFFGVESATAHALRLLTEGADIVDIGGESTRPFSAPVTAEEELRRVLPVVEGVKRKCPGAIVSVDTSKAAVAQAALTAGAEIMNDVTGLAGDPQMLDVVRRSGAGVCVMHMQGTPQTMQIDPAYDNVVEEIHAYLRDRRDALLAAGLAQERICLDPGIGFGKTHQHNLTLMANCWRFLDLGCPVLVGHSRKGFIGKVIGDKEADRTAGSIGGALSLARQGVHILRVHDVQSVRQALLVFDACGGIDGKELILPTSGKD
jgi:dihydropteroate synthase